MHENTVGPREVIAAVATLSRALRSRAHTAPHRQAYAAETLFLQRLETLGEVRAGELATHMRLDQSVISRRLAALEQRGLVERRPDPTDARASLVQLTELGRTQAHEQMDALGSSLARDLDSWTPEDYARVHQLLLSLSDLVAGQRDSTVVASA
jgi:DNA-binding MarR family transcriptional regulator